MSKEELKKTKTVKELPKEIAEMKNNGVKIIKLDVTGEGYAITLFFRKPSKADFKMNLDKIVSASMNGKSFSMVTHMENSIKRQLVCPTIEEFSEFLDSNLQAIGDIYNRLFGEAERKLDFFQTEV